ncbi:MAG TPA: ABC transporter permease [Planctomycetota bacterium]|nr:ABC transporter permease [Planctomycetota bacterium]
MRKELGMSIALVVMCALVGLSNREFFGTGNISDTSRQIAMLGIYAIGVSFVIVTGGIDLSIGSIIGLTGVIIARISTPAIEGKVAGMGYPIGIGICVALAVALSIGLIQGLLITRLNLQPFIVTLAGMLIIRGVSQTITQGGNISFGATSFPDLANEGIHLGPSLTLTYPVFIFLGVALVATYVLHFTVFGRHVFAIGGNRDAARYSGVPVKRVEVATYVISAGLAGVAGIPVASYISQMSHSVGVSYELYAIAAAVLGGVSLRGGEGTIFGVFIGAAIMRVMENGINMFKLGPEGNEWRLDKNKHDIVIGAVILGAVILDQVTHILQDRKKLAGKMK